MFTSTLFNTQGVEAEVKSHLLKPFLTLKIKQGYGVTQKRMYESAVVPYPNDKCFETNIEVAGIITTKRQYLTPERVVFIHLIRTDATKTEAIIDARLIFAKTLALAEFRLMLPQSLEPYFA